MDDPGVLRVVDGCSTFPFVNIQNFIHISVNICKTEMVAACTAVWAEGAGAESYRLELTKQA